MSASAGPVSDFDRLPVTVIEPRRSGSAARAREVWQYRGLLRYVGLRLVKKMYARTVLGRLWIPLRPLLEIAPQILIFGGVIGVASGGIPYPLFFITGVAVWEFFSRLLYWITRSVELNRSLLKNLYFPRLVMPLAAAGPAVLQATVVVVFAAAMVLYYAIVKGHWYLVLGPQLLLVPAGVILVVGLAYGVGLWLAVFGAQVRDVRFGLGIVLGLWYLLTPVIYPLSAVPDSYRRLAEVNPMTAPVQMIKAGLFDVGSVPGLALASSLVGVLAALASGMWFFGRAADLSIERM